jgi:2,4-dienoyl-CoA reductase (NADPH2)
MGKLFDPIHIQGLRLKNRIVSLPVFTGYALPDARVSPLMIEHYRRLAESGAAVVTVANVAVAEDGRTSERSLLLSHDRYIDGLGRLASMIKANGALACVQLNHAGRYAVTDHPLLPSAMDTTEIKKNISTLKNFMGGFPFAKRFGLTTHFAKMTAGWIHQMSDADIHHIIERFGDAAYRAFSAGFDMVELHGASGYLIAQFLSPRTNRRTAPWGDSLKARMRFPLRIVAELKSRLPESVPVGFRLIMDEIIENGISPDEAIVFARNLTHRGVAYLSATMGTYQSMFMGSVMKQLARPGYLVDLTKTLKQHVTVPVIISGRIVSPILAEKILKKEAADIIGLGRPLLADKDWIKKTGHNGKIIGCKNCNTCFKNVALGESLICDRWPKVVQDRIKLETRFYSRHGYRTLIVLSSSVDLEIAREHIRQSFPIHPDILNRQLFINTKKESGFIEAAQKHVEWCDQYLRTHLKRAKLENVIVDIFKDPVDVIMEHLQDNFGFVSIFHDETSEWKRSLVLRVPADVVVGRIGPHPNMKKVLIPCDLSTFTLMQIRVALHLYHGRSDVQFRFVHVAQDRNNATDKWSRILDSFEMDPSTKLKILRLHKESSVAETLLREAKKGAYGSLIIGRRGGLARVHRRIFGSVSERLLRELPECSFAIVG